MRCRRICACAALEPDSGTRWCYAVRSLVEDPQLFRQLLRQSARARSLHIRFRVAGNDPETVWAVRRDDEWEFTNPVAEADLHALAEAMDRALPGTLDT